MGHVVAVPHQSGKTMAEESDDKNLFNSLLADKTKKAAGNRLRHRWLRMSKEGELCEVTMGKAAMVHRLGIQPRDLRLMDNKLGSPPAVLVRDQAIVINLEFLKTIITRDYAMIMDSGEERVSAFVSEHRRRLRDPEGSTRPKAASGKLPGITEEAPFELRALEVVLDFVTLLLEFLVSELEKAVHPVLDAIVNKITSRRLERLRSVKNRMVRLTTRVETIRELLEKLLDDDDDMRDMNLTARARHAAMDERRHQQISNDTTSASNPADCEGKWTPSSWAVPPTAFDKNDELERDKDQVEQVLETYFMSVDNTYNRVQILAEFVEDTEDLVKFDMDMQRNRFIEYRLVMQFAMLAAMVVANIANVLTINAGLPDVSGFANDGSTAWRDTSSSFVLVGCIASVGSVILLVTVFGFLRYKRLLFW